MYIALIITLLLGVISFIIYLYYSQEPEAWIKINFIDFKENNFYNKVSVNIKNLRIFKSKKIKEKNAIIKINGFKNKKIIEGQLNLMNTIKKSEKNFKIKIYKNRLNVINIKINNDQKDYFNSEIIFYYEESPHSIKSYNLETSSYNSKNMERLLIYNFTEAELIKIINDNCNDQTLKNKAFNTIKGYKNQLLLLNIFIGKNKTNILIFKDEEKQLIIPTKEEKKDFENLYWDIYNNLGKYSLDIICNNFKSKLIKKGKLFGSDITNLESDDDINNYFSFMNQGINSLFVNEIISKNSYKDYCFILGYMLFYAFIHEKMLEVHLVENFFETLSKCYKRYYSYPDLIRVAVSYIIFSVNKINSPSIKFTDEMKKESPYYKGFEFFKNIIQELDEDSDLIFIYLQINSGCGFELINQENCFKISMISLEDIKSHIIETIPKYFYTYSSKKENYIATDSRTQVMAFNEKKIFDHSSNNQANNNMMNVTIGLFHESGHAKLHMNIEVGGDETPLNCMNKKFDFTKKFHYNDKTRGESGKFIDHFLYDSNYDEIVIDLIKSNKTNELMDKKFFIGNLELLKEKAEEILSTNPQNNNQNINNDNNLNSLSHLSSKFQSNISDDEENERLMKIGIDIDY